LYEQFQYAGAKSIWPKLKPREVLVNRRVEKKNLRGQTSFWHHAPYFLLHRVEIKVIKRKGREKSKNHPDAKNANQ
jgi:DNA modification methylase